MAGERLRIVAGLIRITGDWELAEDCVQDAVERALARWPRDGVPDNPAAWLTTTAHRRALDVLRRRKTEAAKMREVASMADLEWSSGAGTEPDADRDELYRDELYRDDVLRLVFTCCHPALPLAGRVALTLKTVAGLSTREIARAFLVPESTMSQRLLRARAKIAHTGIRLRVPAPHRLAERTDGVLAVIYLVFTEGYAGTEGDAIRDDLAAEAVRLAGLLAQLLPDDDEVNGLQALLLLQHARRAARTDAAGNLVPMDEQDRSRWDQELVTAGLVSLGRARGSGRPPGAYRLQAEIAAVHSTAADAGATDWVRVVGVYDALLRVQPSPVVALNRAVAVGFADGPDAGLRALADVDPDGRLGDYYLLAAARADLLRRAGRHQEASTAYAAALSSVRTDAVRRFLQRRALENEAAAGLS